MFFYVWMEVKNLIMKQNYGEKASKMVCELLANSSQRRKRLKDAGWERVLNPPLVGNQWLWKHPQWHVQLENEAIKIMDSINEK